jgi:TatA/E family protein of Tat protein translocase
VVLLFGAKKLPELARGLGQSLGEFKKARDEFERELRNSTPEVEVKTPADKPPHQPSPESVHAEGVVSGSKETEKPA